MACNRAYYALMTSLRHIRKSIFAVTQAEFARIAGVTQATVSRWERGELTPNLGEMQKIRTEALARNLEWRDTLFFARPPEPVDAGRAA